MVTQLVSVVFVIGAGLWWTDHRFADLEREERTELCGALALQVGGPPPVEGPAGDRARHVLASLDAYRGVLGCEGA